LIDALLLALSLLAAHALRYYGTSWFDLSKSIDPFQDSQWLLIVVMPFGPILLDVQALVGGPGFQNSASHRSRRHSELGREIALINIE